MTPESITLDPPLLVGSITLLRWIEGHTYESDTGATYYSGADEPSQADAEDCIATPRAMTATATSADIAAHRYTVENGGVTVSIGGTPHRFDTTRENRSMWLAVREEARVNPDLVQPWKTLDGEFIGLASADIETVAAAVYAHVRTAFEKEAELLANPPTVAELPAAGWPS